VSLSGSSTSRSPSTARPPLTATSATPTARGRSPRPSSSKQLDGYLTRLFRLPLFTSSIWDAYRPHARVPPRTTPPSTILYHPA
jgi:hypothetical protein